MSSRAQQPSPSSTTKVASPGRAGDDVAEQRSTVRSFNRDLRSTLLLGSLQSLWRRFSTASGLRFQGRARRLQLQESVQLGEKRFVAILRVDGDEFLLGGGASGVSILGQLQPEPAAELFSTVLARHRVQGEGA